MNCNGKSDVWQRGWSSGTVQIGWGKIIGLQMEKEAMGTRLQLRKRFRDKYKLRSELGRSDKSDT